MQLISTLIQMLRLVLGIFGLRSSELYLISAVGFGPNFDPSLGSLVYLISLLWCSFLAFTAIRPLHHLVNATHDPFDKYKYFTTAHSWRNNHSTSISNCKMWKIRTEIQVSKKKPHTHIHLDYARLKFLSCIIKD